MLVVKVQARLIHTYGVHQHIPYNNQSYCMELSASAVVHTCTYSCVSRYELTDYAAYPPKQHVGSGFWKDFAKDFDVSDVSGGQYLIPWYIRADAFQNTPEPHDYNLQTIFVFFQNCFRAVHCLYSEHILFWLPYSE